MRLVLSFMILLAAICVSGCARWDKPETRSRIVFPQAKIPADAVGLEFGIAEIDSATTESFEELWRLLDQQALPLDLRKRLDQNGIRAAIMSTRPPRVLHELVGEKQIIVSELTPLEKQLYKKGLLRPQKRMVAHERISNREGQTHPIVVSETHPQVSWIIRSGDKQTAGSGENVRGLITLTTFPQGDGSVRIVLIPEIHHGRARHQIGVAERSFLLHAGQTVNQIEDLKFEVTLRPGESIVIAPTADVADLGKLFFGSDQKPNNLGIEDRAVFAHRMLMIRVVQTQLDDLFDSGNKIEKLTTTPRH